MLSIIYQSAFLIFMTVPLTDPALPLPSSYMLAMLIQVLTKSMQDQVCKFQCNFCGNFLIHLLIVVIYTIIILT